MSNSNEISLALNNSVTDLIFVEEHNVKLAISAVELPEYNFVEQLARYY